MKRSIILFCCIFILVMGSIAFADIPYLINYQGYLTDASGNPYSDTTLDITFSLYRDNGNLLWTSGPQPVYISNGTFTYVLGSSVPLTADNISKIYPRWFGIKIGDDPEITPRTQFVSVPYAYHSLHADTSNFAHVSNVLQLNPIEDPGICDETKTGFFYYDLNQNEPCYCNGTNWIKLSGDGLCIDVCFDIDGDGYDDCDPTHEGDTDGLPQDCDDTNNTIYPGATEFCDDAIDNDCDGFDDCNDIDCNGSPSCTDEICDDGIDNDGDSYIDCDDVDCSNHPSCSEAVCDDGIDNDGDGFTDCDDFDCNGSPSCTTEICDDGIDNDGDGYTDCDDFDCREILPCEVCADGIDNDGDGFTDCEDLDCTCVSPEDGDLVITEFMANPANLPDTQGEWIEILNVSGSHIDIFGLELQDATSSHTINQHIVIPNGGYVVLANSSQPGFTPDYLYTDLSLNNGGDQISLIWQTTTIDIVVYGSAVSGISKELSTNHSDAASNDNSTNWCNGVTIYGSGDSGTPGALNDCNL